MVFGRIQLSLPQGARRELRTADHFSATGGGLCVCLSTFVFIPGDDRSGAEVDGRRQDGNLTEFERRRLEGGHVLRTEFFCSAVGCGICFQDVFGTRVSKEPAARSRIVTFGLREEVRG